MSERVKRINIQSGGELETYLNLSAELPAAVAGLVDGRLVPVVWRCLLIYGRNFAPSSLSYTWLYDVESQMKSSLWLAGNRSFPPAEFYLIPGLMWYDERRGHDDEWSLWTRGRH